MSQGCDAVSTRFAVVISVVSWWRDDVGGGRVMIRVTLGKVFVVRGWRVRLCVARVSDTRCMSVVVGDLSGRCTYR